MTPDRAVFERNLAALIGRAYEPVRARPHFVAELRARLLAEAARRPAGRRRAPGKVLSIERLRVAAAAAVLVAAITALVVLVARTPAGWTDLLARGEIAHRPLASARWVGLRPHEGALDRALSAAAGEWALPEGVTLLVEGGPRGTLSAFGPARLALEPEPEPGLLLARLDDGRVRLALAEEGVPWELDTCDGRVVVLSGEVSVVARAHLPPGRAVEVDLGTAQAWIVGRDGKILGPRKDLKGQLPQPLSSAAGARPLEPSSPAPAGGHGGVLAAAEVPSLTGLVRAAHSGEPIAAFRVTLVPRLKPPNVADPHVFDVAAPDGRFVVGPVPPGPYVAFVHASGWAPLRRPLELVAGSTLDLGSLELGSGASLTGLIVEAASRRPLAGAWIVSEADAPTNLLPLRFDEGEDPPPGAVQSGPDGRFRLGDLSAGPHVFRASAAGHAPSWSPEVAVEPGRDVGELVLALSPGARVHGRVRRSDGTSWPFAVVVASYASRMEASSVLTYGLAIADESGEYAIADLPPGHHAVLVVQGPEAGSPPDEGAVPIDAASGEGWTASHFTLIELRPDADVRVDLPPSAAEGVRLHGVVQRDGAPAGGQMIGLVDLSRPDPWGEDRQRYATSRADGSYEILGLRPGKYVVFHSPGPGPEHVVVDQLNVADVLEQRHDLSLRAGTLAVRTVAAADEAPLPFAVVVLMRREPGGDTWDYAGKLFTDATGRVTIPSLAPGDYRVVAIPTSGLFAPSATEVRLDDDSERPELVLRHELGGRLLVRVVDREGSPVAGALVRLFDAEGREQRFNQEQQTDAHGAFSIQGLPAGSWRVRVESAGRGELEQSLEMSAGASLEVTCPLPAPGS